VTDVLGPLAGRLLPLDQVPDPVFAGEMVGPGVAIEPAARGESVRAPIAGKVVKVLVAVGDQVAPGSAVIVLEAMKMENELAAPRDGTVKRVLVRAGDTVERQALLVELA